MRRLKLSPTHWRDAARAGAIGGAAMLLHMALMAAWSGEGALQPLGALAPNGPSAPSLAVGLAVHGAVAAAWGVAYGAYMAVLGSLGPPGLARSWTGAALLGLGWGLAVYLLMGLLVGPALHPRVFMIAPLPYFAGHLTFGLVTALWLTREARR